MDFMIKRNKYKFKAELYLMELVAIPLAKAVNFAKVCIGVISVIFRPEKKSRITRFGGMSNSNSSAR
jgi:hypothetical protein